MPSFDRAALPQTPMACDGLDRRTADRAQDALLAEYLASERTLFLVLGGPDRVPSEVLSAKDDGGPRALIPRRLAEPLLASARAVVALGQAAEGEDPAGVVAVLAEQGPLPATSETTAVPVRTAMAQANAPATVTELSALSQGQAVMAWHATHLFSPETGAPTRQTASGWVRVSEDESTEFFPRTDPAVIVALVDEQDRLILGHNAAWPSARFSTFAGFVEPSETPEEAVVRELREEAGVVVDRVRYLGSQPWPFPRSLMLGYIASTSTPPVPDGEEITRVRAFSRDELRAAVAAGEVELPGELSISRSLITAWLMSEEDSVES